MQAIQKIKGDDAFNSIKEKCNSLLKEEFTIDDVLTKLDGYFVNSNITHLLDWEKGWPQHNDAEQMLFMRTLSSEIIDMHKDKKELMTAELSELCYNSCGIAMLDESWAPRNGTTWVGHDLVATLM